MPERILIAYATKAGSTAEVAARIGEVLTRRGLAVDVLPVGEVQDLEPYSAVVLGSAIRTGKLLPEAMAFIDDNQETFEMLPFSVFIVCWTLKDTDAESVKIVNGYLDPVRALVTPVHEGMFAGVMDLSRLKWSERLLMRFLKVQQGDFRKWDEIEAWAEELV
jgi:menaquinone-dependent protoporphyrinogen oxidase